MRVGSAGTHPFSLFERQRITARDRYRNLVDQMQYVARRELIFGMHVHVAVDDAENAIQVVNGLLPHLAQLSLCPRARRSGAASRPVSPPPGRWSSPRSPAPARRPASATTPTTPRSSASWSAPAASPTTRTSGGTSASTPGSARSSPDLRRGHARRGRDRDRGVLPGAREDALGAARPRRRDPLLPPDPHRREQVARRPVRARGPGDGSLHRRRNRFPSPSWSAGRSGRSSRTRASSAPRTRSTGSARSSPAATAPTASSASTTPTATSSRSSASSRTRPRRFPLRGRDLARLFTAASSALRPSPWPELAVDGHPEILLECLDRGPASPRRSRRRSRPRRSRRWSERSGSR